jgi:hypothetical protein
MKYPMLQNKIAIFERLAKFGNRKDFLDALVNEAELKSEAQQAPEINALQSAFQALIATIQPLFKQARLYASSSNLDSTVVDGMNFLLDPDVKALNVAGIKKAIQGVNKVWGALLRNKMTEAAAQALSAPIKTFETLAHNYLSQSASLTSLIPQETAPKATIKPVNIIGNPHKSNPFWASVQKALLQQGISVGPAGADGILGPNTKAALQQYRKQHPETASLNDVETGRAIKAKPLGVG